ncbi:MATE family efflux transporter [Candidatus Bathyarchaeota archaeon]|nr:MATE family efflux transporter [Candidatus Bathyarchaeota archaeon]
MQRKEAMREEILSGNIFKTAFKLSWPVMLSHAFQTFYNMTDAYWLGKVGPEAVAAPSISWPIMFLLISISAGFGIAGISLVSQYVGANRHEDAEKVSGQLYSIFLVSSVIIAVIGVLSARIILGLMNVPEAVIPVAANFLRITFLGVPFMFLSFGFQALLRGYGDTRTPMILSISSAILDAISDPFFIFGWMGLPALGASGAALTTVITRGLAGVVGTYLLFSGRVDLHLHLRDLKPDWDIIKKIFRIGLPSSVGQSGTALGFTVITSLVATEDRVLGGMGYLLSAYGIGSRISSVVQIVIMGGTTALSTMVGQNIGANNDERVMEIVKMLFAMFIGISVLEVVILFVFRVPIYAFFINDPNVIDLGSTYMTYFVPFFPFFTIFQLSMSVLQAAGKTRITMILSLIRLWGMRILFAYILYYIFNMGSLGIWLGLGIGNLTGAAMSIIYLWRANWVERIID